jgi:hypothetical protein
MVTCNAKIDSGGQKWHFVTIDKNLVIVNSPFAARRTFNSSAMDMTNSVHQGRLIHDTVQQTTINGIHTVERLYTGSTVQNIWIGVTALGTPYRYKQYDTVQYTACDDSVPKCKELCEACLPHESC